MRRTKANWRLAVALLMAALSLVVPATSASAGIPFDQAAKIASHSSQMSLAKAPAALTRAVRARYRRYLPSGPGAGPAQKFSGTRLLCRATRRLVGALERRAGGNNNLAGAAYVFTESNGTWSQQAELTGS